MNIGVTGQNGFLGKSIINHCNWLTDHTVIDFKNNYFDSDDYMDSFVKKCDVVLHLASLNRNKPEDEIYNTNLTLTKKLIASVKRTSSKPHIIFSSSIHEKNHSAFGKSKKYCRELLNNFSSENNNIFTGLIIPNIFGPFCKPNYNSFISTFSYNLINDKDVEIINDTSVELIYIDDLCKKIIEIIEHKTVDKCLFIRSENKYKVSDILEKLKSFKRKYYRKNEFPELNNSFEIKLFNTFRSYIDHQSYFPRK